MRDELEGMKHAPKSAWSASPHLCVLVHTWPLQGHDLRGGSAGAAKEAVCSKASPVQNQPLQGAGSLQNKASGAIDSRLPDRTTSQDPCSYWRFRGKQDVVGHVQTHQ